VKPVDPHPNPLPLGEGADPHPGAGANPGDGIEKHAKELLEQSIEHLDGRTLSRLNRARHAALDEVQRSRQAFYLAGRRWWMPATGVAAAAVLAVMIGQGMREKMTPSATADGSLLDDFEIVADADNLEMLEDVEFYSWLPDDASEAASGS
jgi:hypothetical protein